MHLSMPICAHSVSIAHCVHSCEVTGTHSDRISPFCCVTSKQPQPSGHVPHATVHTPLAPTRMHRFDVHCDLSVHGWPKPASVASGGPSGAASIAGAASGVSTQVFDVESHV